MTDKEIEKALECCSQNIQGKCSVCPLFKSGTDCVDCVLEKQTLDYINRLKDKIYQAEQKLAECENGYESTLFLERCKAKTDQERIRKEMAKEILQKLLEATCSEKKRIAKHPYDNKYETQGAKSENELAIMEIKRLAKEYGVEL